MKKRKTAMLCAMLLVAAIPAGCSGGGNSGVTKPADLDPKDFVSEEKFITIADLPPNPFENLETYASLGFSGYILTKKPMSRTPRITRCLRSSTAVRNPAVLS